MFQRFTQEARRVVVLAQEEARMLRDPAIGTQHLLVGLTGTGGDTASRALHSVGLEAGMLRAALLRQVDSGIDGSALAGLGIDLDAVRRATDERFGVGAIDRIPDRRLPKGHIPFGFGAKKSLELALRSAVSLQSREISTGHLLLGIMDEGRDRGSQLLRECHIDLPLLRAEVVTLLTERAA